MINLHRVFCLFHYIMQRLVLLFFDNLIILISINNDMLFHMI